MEFTVEVKNLKNNEVVEVKNLVVKWAEEEIKNNKFHEQVPALDFRKRVFDHFGGAEKFLGDLITGLEGRDVSWHTPYGGKLTLEVSTSKTLTASWVGRRGGIWGYNGAETSEFIEPLAAMLLKWQRDGRVKVISHKTSDHRLKWYETLLSSGLEEPD